jgi:hypothetical protein
MIHNFKKWALIEHFGNGEEIFEQDLEMYGKLRNLDITAPIGWEIDGATGKLTYRAVLDVNSSGIDDISFFIEKVELEIENRVYSDESDEDGELKVLNYTFDSSNIGTDPKVEIYNMPFYLNNLEVDFRKAEDLDGEIDMKKVEFMLEIGNIKE